VQLNIFLIPFNIFFDSNTWLLDYCRNNHLKNPAQ
jgi:hypothetical protein